MEAFQLMASKGVDAKVANGLQHCVYVFRSGNVTGSDLAAFVPAFNGYALSGFPRIGVNRLNGSKVSAEAVRHFRHAVPECSLGL